VFGEGAKDSARSARSTPLKVCSALPKKYLARRRKSDSGVAETDLSMNFKDHFSKQAADYAKFRPRYPHELFEYLGSVAPSRTLAWECATGNGQAAVELAKVFDRVIATDASEKQISEAQPHERVEYRVAPAEKSGIDSETIDLIMVAQALHWFDLDRFYAEARRVLKPNGVLAASAYNLLQIAPAIDKIVNRYYYEVVGPFWPPERALVENFEVLPFPSPEITPSAFEMVAHWNLEHLLGYLRSWSATQRFIAANNRDPLNEITKDLSAAWSDPNRTRRVIWPSILRVAIKMPERPA
jgi:ubiquinone/menaquinone biosynthesis C-methylase UbiE